ncbi:MAG TPA: sigma-70 family RNA polymerase sigma factor [Iamia sp.]|nr:sigma-70 family RNA polymerase sigma factor [Iamia sp.]
MTPEPASSDQGAALLDLYDRALPEVYGYLLPRCGSVATAEDVTSETFLAAVDAVQRGTVPHLSVAWLIGVARHKLVDHWRRTAREERRVLRVAAEPDATTEDPWDEEIDAALARDVLASLGAHHRAALTLRYLDGLSVPEVARHLDRTVHATEALLIRAKAAFRRALPEGGSDA